MASTRTTMITIGVVFSVVVLSVGIYLHKKQEGLGHHSESSSKRNRKRLQDRKPQESFKGVLADNSLKSFVHLRTEENESGYLHPYGKRLRALLEHPRLSFPFMQPGYEDPPGMAPSPIWIETRKELEALTEVLIQEFEFAVDTEQHSSHSFHGFTALVQISTRKADYVIDSIGLHDYMHILGPVFANPDICKLFHGADSDILWLQRDFHIYVVNLFDTAKASLILGRPQRSLASLLESYCGVFTNKAFQRADWRIRPLPEDMLEYARTDTHYLLYIAHQLCMELIKDASDEGKQEVCTDKQRLDPSPLLEEALYRSNLNCLQLYEKEGVSTSPSSTAAALLSRFYNSSGFHPRQMPSGTLDIVSALCKWRDAMARREDESLRSVLSDNAIMALASSTPSTPGTIYTTISAADASPQVPEVSPGTFSIVPSIRSPSLIVGDHADDLCRIIREASTASLLESSPPNALAKLEAVSKSWYSKLIEKAFHLFQVSAGAAKDDGYRSGDGPSSQTSDFKIPKAWTPGGVEKSRIQFVKKFSCKAPVYHNCRIYADDGRLLCFCDRKKLEWYVHRELAEYVQEDPPAVRLLFEPKGRPDDEDNDFYVQSKSNRCVGCGESSHYLRYRIIPSCYRQHFPEHLKSHRSHDIVLLCVDCHEIAHKAADKHKRQIAIQYNVPLFTLVTEAEGLVGGGGQSKGTAFVKSNDADAGVSLFQLKSAAVALLRYGPTIPDRRRRELEKVLQTFYGREDISQDDIVALLDPQEQRRMAKRGFWNKEGAAATTGELTEHGGGPDESPSTQACPSASLQEEEKDETLVQTTTVDLTQDADTAVLYPAGSQTKISDSAPRWSHVRAIDNDNDPSAQTSSAQRRPGRHKNRRNEALLGHGAHGKKIVENLMQAAGDEGIRNFSQEWRKVFVDALRPAFLPPGWDIFHSGRREFGDFSVYKPQGEGL